MTSEFIQEEISMLFCSEKFYGGGWWWHCNYSYKLQVQVSNQRFEIDLGPGPELDNKQYDNEIIVKFLVMKATLKYKSYSSSSSTSDFSKCVPGSQKINFTRHFLAGRKENYIFKRI